MGVIEVAEFVNGKYVSPSGKVYYEAEDKLSDIIKKNEENIASDVLGKSIVAGIGEGFSKELDINGLKVNVTVKR